MGRSKKKRDPIPEHFKTLDAAAKFWDTHDLADYWDQTSEANFEVDLQRRVFLTALEPELAKKLVNRAHKEGVSTETLVNVWLTEKLGEGAQGPGAPCGDSVVIVIDLNGDIKRVKVKQPEG